MSVLKSQQASSTDTEIAQSAYELWTVCCRLNNYYVNTNDSNQTNTNKAIFKMININVFVVCKMSPIN